MTPRLPTPANRSLETVDGEPLVLFRRSIRSGSLLRRGATMSAVGDSGGFKASTEDLLVLFRPKIHRGSSLHRGVSSLLQSSIDDSSRSRSVEISSKVLVNPQFAAFNRCSRSRFVKNSSKMLVNPMFAGFDRSSRSRFAESTSVELVDHSPVAVPGADPWKAGANCSLVFNNSWSRVVGAVSSPQRRTWKQQQQKPSQPNTAGDDDGGRFSNLLDLQLLSPTSKSSVSDSSDSLLRMPGTEDRLVVLRLVRMSDILQESSDMDSMSFFMLCFVLDLRCLSPPLLRDLRQSLLQIANFHAISSSASNGNRSKLKPLLDRIGLCYVFKNWITCADELKVAYSPGGYFNLRDIHHAVSSLPSDALTLELNNSMALCGVDMKLSNVLHDKVLYSWGSQDKGITRKVVLISSCIVDNLDLVTRRALMDAADKCVVSVEFVGVSKHVSEKILIEIDNDGRGFWQNIVVEKVASYCGTPMCVDGQTSDENSYIDIHLAVNHHFKEGETIRINVKNKPSIGADIMNENWVNEPNADVILLFFIILSVSHTAIRELNEETGIFTYEAESPDEDLFLLADREFGFKFCKRTQSSIVVRERYPSFREPNEREVKLLNLLDFTSKRKRMSIIVRDETGQIFFLLYKGADSVKMYLEATTKHLNVQAEEVSSLSLSRTFTLSWAYNLACSSLPGGVGGRIIESFHIALRL